MHSTSHMRVLPPDMFRAILIMFIAMSCIPAGDSASKIMTSQLGVDPAYVIWTRFALGALVLLPFTYASFVAHWKDWRIWFRASLVGLGISSITLAFKAAPLADVFGAFFVGPMISFLLSVVLLKERAHPAQAFLIAVGFAGVLLIVRPGFEWNPGLGYAVLAGCCYGAFLTASRWLAGTLPLGALMLSQMVGPALAATPVAVAVIPDLSAQVIWLTLASSLFSMAGNVLMLFAYRLEQASKLAPFVYFQLIAAVGLGWAIFSELPNWLTVTGMCVLITSGVVSAVLQTRRPKPLRA